MASHAAFLRGMNVGGHRITNDDLRRAFEEMGFDGAAVYQASGNVAVDARGETDAQMVARIEEGLDDALGYAVPTFVRSAEEMRALAEERPFPDDAVEASKGKLQVLVLRAAPSAADRKAALALAGDDDRLAFSDSGAELYWLPSGGTMESELDHKALGKAVGLATQRTKGTVERMTGKFFAG